MVFYMVVVVVQVFDETVALSCPLSSTFISCDIVCVAVARAVSLVPPRSALWCCGSNPEVAICLRQPSSLYNTQLCFHNHDFSRYPKTSTLSVALLSLSELTNITMAPVDQIANSGITVAGAIGIFFACLFGLFLLVCLGKYLYELRFWLRFWPWNVGLSVFITSHSDHSRN